MKYFPFRRNQPLRRKHRKKAVLTDFKTKEEIVLANPRYGRKNRKECLGGCRLSGLPRWHDSGEEAFYCNKLRLLKKAGEIQEYESQVSFDLRDAAGKWIGRHRVDFVVTEKDGIKTVHEYKGYESEDWKLRRALFSWNYPDLPYQVKKERDLI